MYRIEFKINDEWHETHHFFDKKEDAEIKAKELQKLDGFRHRTIKEERQGEK